LTAGIKTPGLRARLIDAAWQLFASMGYHGTTIERIIDCVGVSKGAFYHYFLNKEEVLDAAITRMIAGGLEEVQPLVESESLSAIQKLNAFLAASRRWRLANMGAVLAVAEVLLRDQNIIIRHKMYKSTLTLWHPLLSRIIVQGVREGFFDVVDSEETSLWLLNLMNVVSEIQTQALLQSGQDPQGLVLLRRRAALLCDFFERILGAPRGCIEPVGDDGFERASGSAPMDRASGKEEDHGTAGNRQNPHSCY
jgi:AcrR family transcriptional regulator